MVRTFKFTAPATTPKKLFHFLVLGSCPLRHSRHTFLEMTKTRIRAHSFEMASLSSPMTAVHHFTRWLSWTIFHSIPLPLNPIQLSSSFHPSQTFHQCFCHFCYFQTLHDFVASSHVTRHTSHRHTVIPSSLFFIVSFRHYHPSLFQIFSAPIKFRASFSVMWLDDHHLTSLHSCGEQLLYCFSDLMTLFLVILFSTVYLRISVFLYIRNSCSSARLQFVID